MRHPDRAARWLGLVVLLTAAALAQDASTLYRNAEQAFDDRQYGQAVDLFKSFVDRFPDDNRAPRALYRLGECQGALKQYEDAAQTFQATYKRYPDSSVADSALYNEGFYDFQAEKWINAAYAYYLYTTQGKNPAFKAQAWYWRGEALYKLNRFKDAVEAYEKLLAQPAAVLEKQAVADLIPFARYSIAVAWFDAKDWAKSLAAVKTVLAKHPNTSVAGDSLWYGGQALRNLGRYDEAVQFLTRLADEYPKSSLAPDALYAVSEIETARGHKEAAAKARDRLVRDYPKAGNLASGVRFASAAEALRAKDYASAQKLYRQALQGATGAAEAAGLLGLAEASVGLEQWDTAADAYRALLARYPNDANALRAKLGLGEALIHDGKYADAETLYRGLLKGQLKDKEAVLARFNLALALVRQNRAAEAMDLFRAAAKLDPNGETGAAALLEVGRYSLEQKQYGDARTAYQDYLKTHATSTDAPLALWGIGEASYALKEWPRAADAYQTLIDKFPKHAQAERAYYRLVEVYKALGQDAKADQIANALRKQYPTSKLSAATLLDRGREAFKAHRYGAAAEAFDSFLQSYPDHDSAPAAMANLAASLYLATDVPDHWRRAAETYARLAKRSPATADDAQFWAGSAWLEAGQPKNAIEALRGFLKDHPDHTYSPRAQVLLGKALAGTDQPADAIAPLQAAAAAAKADAALRAEARYELAWAQINAGKDDDGYATFKALVADDPKSPFAADARFRLAGRAYQQKKYDEAITGYKEWLAQYPTNALRPKAVYNLAFAQEAKGDFTGAAASYAEAEKLLGDNDQDLRQQAAYRRGYALYKCGNAADALKALEAFDNAYPQSKLKVEALYYRGQALSALQRWEEAGAAFRQLTDQHADHLLAPSAKLNLGVALQNQQKYDEARSIYQAVLQQANLPADMAANAQLHLGETLYALKQYDEALDAFVRVDHGQVAAVKPAARYWAALCYQRKGETAMAREKLTQVVNETPESEWAAKAKKALAELGR